ncbi:glycosyltransferase [Sphingomonas sp. LY160]|uniref:glycosyltransferase n=1 Tax=Sphingomonas sp. LY160 TaxID=3095342 RepID=UPI002ADEDCB6|nr:glycosyltransferase [Sphingomonas sp. LY160]MEA1072705.1 glycosyltransferase [Sphingomonas sp. LY160]
MSKQPPSADKDDRRLTLLLPDLGGGGAERVAVTLANAFVRKGHDVDVVIMRPGGVLRDLLDPAIRVVDLDAPRIRDVPRRFAAYLRQSKPHAVLVFMWPLTVAAVLARSIARTPTRLVLSEHSILSHEYQGKGVQRLLRWTIRAFYARAQARTTVSEGSAKDLAQLSGLGRDAFEVVGNPLDLPNLPLRRSNEVEPLWGCPPGARILTIGSMKPEKNHPDLVRSLALLPNARLMIVGEGQGRPQLEALAKELGISDRLIMPGFRIDPWPFLASADVFALSSRYEGFGLVLVEALHAGLRIVSTDCPFGPREILADGKYGQLVPVGDEQAMAAALAQALVECPHPDRQRARARETAGSTSSDRYLQLMLG